MMELIVRGLAGAIAFANFLILWNDLRTGTTRALAGTPVLRSDSPVAFGVIIVANCSVSLVLASAAAGIIEVV